MLKTHLSPDGRSGYVEFFNGRLNRTQYSDWAHLPGVVDLAISVRVRDRSGTNPTLVPTVETCEEGEEPVYRWTIVDGDTEGDLTRTTAPTVEGKIQSAGSYSGIIHGGMASLVRLKFTLGGTSPDFNVIARGHFQCRSPNWAS